MSVEEDVMKIQKKLTKMTSDDGTVSEEKHKKFNVGYGCFLAKQCIFGVLGTLKHTYLR